MSIHELHGFTIPIELQNRNKGQGRHWGGTNTDKRNAVKTLATLPNPFDGIDLPVSLVVTRILGRGQRLWDVDSVLRGNWKQIQDAMVTVGWIAGDDTRYIKHVYGTQSSGYRDSGPCVHVCIVSPEAFADLEELNTGVVI